jgi:hypothetical protein
MGLDHNANVVRELLHLQESIPDPLGVVALGFAIHRQPFSR